MSNDVALQAMYERFMGQFVLPLLGNGKKLLVSYPIGPGAESFFEGAQELDPELRSEIIQLRQQALSKIVPSPPPSTLRVDEIQLLASLHNVLLCGHEELVGGFRGQARWEHNLGWAASHLSKVKECGNAETALRRHSLLHLLPMLTRDDTILKTRRGSKRYAGQAPSKLALIWPRLRQVSTALSTVDLDEVIASDDARDLYTEILDRSPLTCLLAMPYGNGGGVHRGNLRWSPQIITVIAQPSLCRAVTYRHLELGFERVGPPLAKALVDGLERMASSKDSREQALLTFGLRYIVNLQLTHLWSVKRDALTDPLERRWSENNSSFRPLFFGWFAAAYARIDRLGAPDINEPEFRERVRQYRRAAAAVAGESLNDAARHIDWIIPPQNQESLQGGQS